MKAPLTGLVLLLAGLWAGYPTFPVSAEETHIVIRKTDRGDTGGDRDRHMVRSGETLGGILSARGFRPNQVPQALSDVLRLNPSLKDPRFIYPGQEILLPRADVDTSNGGPDRNPSGQGTYGPVSSDPPVGALAEARRLRPLLEGTLRQLDENFGTSGTLHLPLGDLGTIDLAGSAYPLIEFSTGRSVILDAEGTLPPAWVSGIPDSWPAYAVLSPGGDSDIRSLLGDIFSLSGYHAVISAEPVTIGREASVTIIPDFLILKSPTSLVQGEVYLVNVEDPSRPALPREIRNLAADHRIRVVEVAPTADNYAPPGDNSYARNFHLKFTSSDRRLLFQELAAHLGIESGDSLPLPTATGAPGLTFTPGQSLVLSHRDRTCLLSFSGENVSFDGLASEGVTELYAGADTPLLTILGQLLEVLGVDFSGPVIEFYRLRDRHLVTVPGLYLLLAKGPVFITDRNMGDHLFSYLAGTGMEVVLLELASE